MYVSLEALAMGKISRLFFAFAQPLGIKYHYEGKNSSLFFGVFPGCGVAVVPARPNADFFGMG